MICFYTYSNFQIIFLDAHHFPVGFYNADGSPIRSVHAGLLELVQRELGPHLASANVFWTGTGTRGPTLQSLLNANKRLLFSYVDNSIVAGRSNYNTLLFIYYLPKYSTRIAHNKLQKQINVVVASVYMLINLFQVTTGCGQFSLTCGQIQMIPTSYSVTWTMQ